MLIIRMPLEELPASEPAELYNIRWHAEIDLRSLKSVMEMNVLRCKTPEMVRKEIWDGAVTSNRTVSRNDRAC